MSTVETPIVEEEDSVPQGSFFSDITDTGGSLLDKMRAKKAAGKRAAAAPRAPKADSTPRERKPSKAVSKTVHDRRAKKVAGMVAKAGIIVSVYGMAKPHTHYEIMDGKRERVPDDLISRDAKVIMEGADIVGEQWATLADENEQVAKAIDAMSLGGAWGGALASLLVILVPLLANHGMVPEMMAAQFTPEAITALLSKADEAAKDAA